MGTALRSILLAALAAVPAAAQGLHPPALLEGMAPDPDEIDMRTTPVVRAVQRAADSVVSVYVLDAADGDPRTALEGQGSGVIVDSSGLVITNWHVVAQLVAAPSRHRLHVRLRDDRSFDATVLSSSSEHDLALLQLALRGEAVKPMIAGRSESLMIGETVIAIGNPQGQANTVTVGVLSAIDRGISVRTPDGRIRSYAGLLQTDAAINGGNSGGALLDITGKLIGINNAMANNAENIGFAIPVDTVKRVFEDVLLSSENLANVWLGVTIDDTEKGPVVASLVPFGPAARAGLLPGDVVDQVFGKSIENKLDFTRAVSGGRPGVGVPMAVRRGGRRVEAQPIAMSGIERELVMRTGLVVEVIPADAAPELARRATQVFYSGSGLRRIPILPVLIRIEGVIPDSPAAEIGFETGDVVLGSRVRDMFGYRNLPLRSIEDLTDRARDAAGRSLFVIVMRGDEALEGPLEVRALEQVR